MPPLLLLLLPLLPKLGALILLLRPDDGCNDLTAAVTEEEEDGAAKPLAAILTGASVPSDRRELEPKALDLAGGKLGVTLVRLARWLGFTRLANDAAKALAERSTGCRTLQATYSRSVAYMSYSIL